MTYAPCSDRDDWRPTECPPSDLRCTGCALQRGMLAGLVRGIKRACGITRPTVAGVHVENVLRRWVLLLTYGAARAEEGHGSDRTGMDPQEWALTISQIVWREPSELVHVPGNSADYMPAVYLVALLRHIGRYGAEQPDVVALMRTKQYKAGILRVTRELTLRARELGLS
jgi:hypothetical protein